MSFITPKEYRQISEKLGDAFALIRDSINDPDSASDAFTQVESALIDVADSTDNDVRVSQAIDPVGSIMSDLGKTWENKVNTSFTEDKAATFASSLFSNMLRSLNNHVKDRTLDPDLSSSTHRTIQDWYDTYAFISGDEDNSLFYNSNSAPDGTSPDGSGGTGAYFTQNFVDLSEALSITIPSAYKQSTYA